MNSAKLSLAALIVLVGSAIPVIAQVSVRFDPASPTVASGGVIDAKVVANIPNPLIGYGLDLQFDQQTVSLDSIEIGPSWFSATTANGSPLVGLAFPDPLSGNNIVLGTLHLHVNQGQCKGTTVLSASAKADDLTEGFALVAGGFADFTVNNATVSLVDTTPPVISNAAADQPTLWPPNHRMVTVTLSYDVSDNCDALQSLACSVSVSSNEPVNGVGSGKTSTDWNVIDAHHVQLRAERSGAGTGRVYTNMIQCADTSGNVSTQSISVTAPHDQGTN